MRTYPSLIFSDTTRARLAALKRRQPRRARALSKKMTQLAARPVAECWVENSWQEDLATHLLLARTLPDQKIAVVCCELDLGCLGLRETIIEPETSREQLRQWRTSLFSRPVDCFPSLGRKIIEHAVEFASMAGFEPPADFIPTFAFYSTIDITRQKAPVVCGVEGKPLLRPREQDDLATLRRKLDAAVGGPPAYTIQLPVGGEVR